MTSLLGIPARADLACLEPLTAVEYDGCLVPDDPNLEQPWTTDPGSNGTPIIEDCQLIISVPDPLGYHGYRRQDAAFAMAESYAMEARMRAEDFYQAGTFVNASFGVSDGAKIAFLSLTHDPLGGATWAVACDQDDCHSARVDWTTFHDYRLEVDKTGLARFFVDGALLHEAAYDRLRPSSLPPQLAVFGGAESISTWDWVRCEACPDAPPENLAPIAAVASLLTTTQGQRVQLDGTASRDPEGEPLTHQWTQTAGPAVVLDDLASPTPGFLAPTEAGPTRLAFELVVNDGALDSLPASAIVDVRPAPAQPLSAAQQAEQVLAEVDNLDIPQVFRRVIAGKIERAMQRPTDAARSEALRRAGRFVFQLRRSGLIGAETTRFDGSLEYTRKLLTAGLGLEQGYAGVVAIASVEPIETALAPGERPARFAVSVRIDPRGLLQGPKTLTKAIGVRVAILDELSGAVVRTLDPTLVTLADPTPAEVVTREVEVSWDGLDDAGEPVELDRSFYVAVFADAGVLRVPPAPTPVPLPPGRPLMPIDVAGTIIVRPLPHYRVWGLPQEFGDIQHDGGSAEWFDCNRAGVVCFVEGLGYLPAGDHDFGFEITPCVPGSIFLPPCGPPMFTCTMDVDSDWFIFQAHDGNAQSRVRFRMTRWELPPYVRVWRSLYQLAGPSDMPDWDVYKRHTTFEVPLGFDAMVVVEVLRYLPRGANKLQWAARAVAGWNRIGMAGQTTGGNVESVVTLRWTVLYWPARYGSTYVQYFNRLALANNQSHGACSSDQPRMIATPTMYSGNSTIPLYKDFEYWFGRFAAQFEQQLDDPENIDHLNWNGIVSGQYEDPPQSFVHDFSWFTDFLAEAMHKITAYRTGIASDDDISMDVQGVEYEDGRCQFSYLWDGDRYSLGESSVWMLHLFND